MWVIEDIRRSAAILVALTGPVSAPSVEYDWLDAMMQAVLVEQANEGPLWGAFVPSVAQLETVRGHLVNGDDGAVHREMNRLMDMLEQRENDIPPEVADRLFDYCYLVMPAKYHDVSRHIDQFIEHQFGEVVG